MDGDQDSLEHAVIVALGSSLPGRFHTVAALLEEAFAGLAREGIAPVRRSRLWSSAAWPDPASPPYLNAVALVDTPHSPGDLLGALGMVEKAFGRAPGPRNAPRTLDLDLIAFGRARLTAPGLDIPHPRAHERFFVMGPLAEIAPGWRHPKLGLTAQELSVTAAIGRDARPLP